MFKFLILLFFFYGCSSNTKWLKQSNDIALEFIEEISQLYPEIGSQVGVKKFDGKGVVYFLDIQEKEKLILRRWVNKLNLEISKVSDKNYKIDLKVLRDMVTNSLDSISANEEEKLLPIFTPSKFVYNNLRQLVNSQSDNIRIDQAINRFNDYVKPENEIPLAKAYEDYLKIFLTKNPKAIFPFERHLKKYLQDSNSYVEGVKELLEQTSSKEWESNYTLFVDQIFKYDTFLKEKILPRSRKNAALPRKVYIQKLIEHGIDKKPEALINEGLALYTEYYLEFKKIAREIALDKKFKRTSPYWIIKKFKEKQITNASDAKAMYENADLKLEKIIKNNKLITLPKRKLNIRIAGPVESRSSPVPHLTTPPLLNNKNNYPEFVVPSSKTGQLTFDDFSYKQAATILTAHEGRPGHDLQFSKMIENKVSLIRALFARNTVNVEGWGLYAEDLVYPYLDNEEKLIALQTRLWRIARYFLDPMVQLSQITKNKVINLFTYDLGVSRIMAEIEYHRYAFRSPGQAPAYLFGLLKIKELKESLEAEFGELNLRCFNDKVISFGQMPHKYILEFKNEFKTCRK